MKLRFKALTTSADTGTSFTGDTGDDTYNGVIGTNGLVANGTTLNPGDNLTGGDGTDKLSVSISGTNTGADLTTAAVTLSSIETVSVSNYDTDDTFANIIDLSLASDVTTVALFASSATGDTTFSGIQSVVAAQISNGSGNLTLTYADAAVTGTADIQTLELSAVTAGTFAVAGASTGGVETLAITSSGSARNVLTGITDDTNLTTITVAGTQALTLGTVGVSVDTLDASSNSGGLTATLSTLVDQTVTGSSGNDVITAGTNLTGTDAAVDAGDGTADTLAVTADAVIAVADDGARYTNFETLSISTTEVTSAVNNTRTQDMSLISGITGMNVTAVTDIATVMDNLVADQLHAVTITNVAATTNTLNITGLDSTDTDAADDLIVSVTATRETSATSDAMTVNLGTATAVSGTTATAIDSGAGAVVLDISLADEESITINSLGGTGTNLVRALTNTAATSVTATGDNALSFASMSSTVVTTIDASAMTAAFIMGTNAGTVASTISGGTGADTLTGGTAADSMVGGAGNDSITGAAGNDSIEGGAGLDTIDAGSGIDNISAGAGNDTISVTTVGDFINLASAEVVGGGDGTDNLSFSAVAVTTIAATDLTGISSIETITINGGANAGSITLTDAVYTANGATTLAIVDGNRTANVAGTLTVDASALTSTNSVTVTGNSLTATNDTLTGGAGNDTFIFATVAGLEATDTVVGGAGTADTITLTATAAVTANLTGVTTVENITTTGTGGNVDITVGASTIAASSTLTTNASSVTNGAFDLDYDGVLVTETTAVQNVTGTAGADTIVGGSGNDIIAGGTGADVITGGVGIDSLTGGTGDDIFVVATTGTGFTGLTTAETVSGGDGNDTLRFTAGIVTIAASDLVSVSGVETIQIQNTSQVASLTLTDAFFTTNGATTLAINSSTATSGVLTLAASTLSSANSVQLDISGAANTANHVINLGAGNDTVTIDMDTMDSTITIAGGAGNDTLIFSENTDNGAQTVDATVTGFETVSFLTAGIAGAFSATVNDANVAAGITQKVNGSNITGTLLWNGAAELDGYFSITGGTGADSLTGGSLVDTISGGSGADQITGGLGADSLSGGGGVDTFVYALVTQSNSSNMDTITDFTTGTDKLQVTLNYSTLTSALTINAARASAGVAGSSLAAEALSGSRGEYVYDTTNSALYINYNADNLLTTSDFKIAMNAASTATASIVEGDINFVITGGAAADVITAGGGADTISGGLGADIITGGAGLDSLTGGGGADTFVLTGTTATTLDTISDWTTTSDTLQISIATYDNAGGSLAAIAAGGGIGAQHTAFVNAAALTGGSVAASTDAALFITLATGAVYWNYDGATAGGLVQIATVGANNIVDADWVLVA